MRVIRLIVFEGTEARIERQMQHALADGVYEKCTRITVKTLGTPHIEGKNREGWLSEVDVKAAVDGL